MSSESEAWTRYEKVKLVQTVVTFIGMILVLTFIMYMKSKETTSKFVDYMPEAPRPCPSDYRCGETYKEQLRMENRLYSDLRESSKYALPETVTGDMIDIPASAAEPVSCMISRANNARETKQPEGQYTPWDEIEAGMLKRTKKQPLAIQPATLSI